MDQMEGMKTGVTGCMPVRAVCKHHSPDLKKRRSSD